MKENGRRIALLSGGILLAAVLSFYFLVDPASERWMPKCVFFQLTGWECPGCGSQRMLHSLLHLDFAGAWRANAFFLLSIPLLCFFGWLEIRRKRHPRLYSAMMSWPVVLAWVILLAGWTLFRNLLPA